MAKSRAWKKANSKPVQPHLPGIPPPLLPGTTRVLPMDLRVGDRLGDETGEWEVISRPYSSPASKLASIHVRKVGQPEVTEIRTWGAHKRIGVKRA
jgi:hypothetical protein